MFETIHNHYEQLVVDRIHELAEAGKTASTETDYLEDVACVALNQLPARYVRHTVDLVFYMTPDERAAMTRAVEEAVESALAYVERHRGEGNRPQTYTAD